MYKNIKEGTVILDLERSIFKLREKTKVCEVRTLAVHSDAGSEYF